MQKHIPQEVSVDAAVLLQLKRMHVRETSPVFSHTHTHTHTHTMHRCWRRPVCKICMAGGMEGEFELFQLQQVSLETQTNFFRGPHTL
jgi:hypothetical protein